jgi:hypothetical protein
MYYPNPLRTDGCPLPQYVGVKCTYSDNFADYTQLPQTFLMIGDMGADPQAPNTIKILEQYGMSFEQTHLG